MMDTEVEDIVMNVISRNDSIIIHVQQVRLCKTLFLNYV